MNEYDFELRVALASNEADIDDLVDRLYEAGCDDSTAGIGRRGHIALMFTRESESAWAAVISAISDVRKAIPDARLEEAGPDLVGLTDVGLLLGVTRQNARKLVVDSQTTNPPPVHAGNPTLWHLADLLHWLREERRYKVPDELIEVAEATMQVNLALGCLAADRRAQQEILALLA